MAGPVVQIQARLGSTRLPGKVLFPLHDRRVLGWVVHRCESAQSVDDVVVTIGDSSENEAIVEWCERSGVRWTTGPEDDLLERHLRATDSARADTIVRITGDCPFVPPDEIDRLVSEHDGRDAPYTTNVTDRMPIGTAVDVVDVDVLEELSDCGEIHPVIPLREDPESWSTVFSDSPDWAAYEGVHIAVDTPTDYWSLIDAVDAVGTDPTAVVKWVAERRRGG